VRRTQQLPTYIPKNPVEIHFGTGSFEHAGVIAKRYGKKALVVTGRRSMRAAGEA